MTKIYDSIVELVGNTPILRLNKWESEHNLNASLLAKCEFYNPLFSVKDRAALKMIEKAEQEQKITEDTVFVEATSGNTGIALAAICASKGYKLVITMPENMSKERIVMMRYLGAEVILTPKEDGMKGAIAKANLLKEKNKNVIMFEQFTNCANADAHRFGTSIEIMEDTSGDVDVLVAGVGTSGTLTGIAGTLKSNNPDLYVVAVEPKSSAVLNGKQAGVHDIGGIGAGFVPPLYDESLVNEVFDVEDEKAWDTAGKIAKIEGLPVGISAGAAIFAATEIAKRKEFAGKNIVVILPDGINNYLSRVLDKTDF
ncbi:MAG: cysteine synthase A [Alphaproteobacteria bacterium]|nr:cysteine synthase A [Alphaproteobacteria bacterium]